MARDMVTRYGMDEGLGSVAHEPKRQQMLDMLKRGARALLEKETLDEAAIRALVLDLKHVYASGATQSGPHAPAGT